METITIFEFVKKESGLVDSEEIHRLCRDIRTYMIKHKFKKITKGMVLAVMNTKKGRR